MAIPTRTVACWQLGTVSGLPRKRKWRRCTRGGVMTRNLSWRTKWTTGTVLGCVSFFSFNILPCICTTGRTRSWGFESSRQSRRILANYALSEPGTDTTHEPKSDQFQFSPTASPEISHHTVWRTWLFIAYPDERWIYYQSSLPHLHISFQRWWDNVLFELRSERVTVDFKPGELRNAWSKVDRISPGVG